VYGKRFNGAKSNLPGSSRIIFVLRSLMGVSCLKVFDPFTGPALSITPAGRSLSFSPRPVVDAPSELGNTYQGSREGILEQAF
jgi:hypothetical protein